jgi:hypothetical protein
LFRACTALRPCHRFRSEPTDASSGSSAKTGWRSCMSRASVAPGSSGGSLASAAARNSRRRILPALLLRVLPSQPFAVGSLLKVGSRRPAIFCAARSRLCRVYAAPMASAELSRRVEKVVGYPPLSELGRPGASRIGSGSVAPLLATAECGHHGGERHANIRGAGQRYRTTSSDADSALQPGFVVVW